MPDLTKEQRDVLAWNSFLRGEYERTGFKILVNDQQYALLTARGIDADLLDKAVRL